MPYRDPADKAAWAKRYHAEHRETVNANKRRWAQRNRLKRGAHVAVGNAIRDGRLVKGPCEHEGPECSGRVEAHHEDYARPLEVRWLCDTYHKLIHVKERSARR